MIPALIILVSILSETLVFAQMPLGIVVPALSIAALIYVARYLEPPAVLIYSLAAGLVYDLIRGSSQELVYFFTFALCGMAIFILQHNLISDNRRVRRFNYLVLAAVCSILFAVLPAAAVIGGAGYRIVVYTFFVQFAFISVYLWLLRLAGSRG